MRDDFRAAIPLEQMAALGRQGKKLPGKEEQTSPTSDPNVSISGAGTTLRKWRRFC